MLCSLCLPDTCFLYVAIDDLKPVTHLLAVDVSSKKGMKFLREGLRYLVIVYDSAHFFLIISSMTTIIIVTDIINIIISDAFQFVHYGADRRF